MGGVRCSPTPSESARPSEGWSVSAPFGKMERGACIARPLLGYQTTKEVIWLTERECVARLLIAYFDFTFLVEYCQ